MCALELHLEEHRLALDRPARAQHALPRRLATAAAAAATAAAAAAAAAAWRVGRGAVAVAAGGWRVRAAAAVRRRGALGAARALARRLLAALRAVGVGVGVGGRRRLLRAALPSLLLELLQLLRAREVLPRLPRGGVAHRLAGCARAADRAWRVRRARARRAAGVACSREAGGEARGATLIAC